MKCCTQTRISSITPTFYQPQMSQHRIPSVLSGHSVASNATELAKVPSLAASTHLAQDLDAQSTYSHRSNRSRLSGTSEARDNAGGASTASSRRSHHSNAPSSPKSSTLRQSLDELVGPNDSVSNIGSVRGSDTSTANGRRAALSHHDRSHYSGRSSTSNQHEPRDSETVTGYGRSTVSHALTTQSRSQHNDHSNYSQAQSHPHSQRASLQTSRPVIVHTTTIPSSDGGPSTTVTRYREQDDSFRLSGLKKVVDGMAQHLAAPGQTDVNVHMRVSAEDGKGKKIHVEGARTVPGYKSPIPSTSSSGRALEGGDSYGGEMSVCYTGRLESCEAPNRARVPSEAGQSTTSRSSRRDRKHHS